MPRRRWRGALWACVALAWAAPHGVSFQAPTAAPAASADSHSPRLIPRTSAEREQRFITQHRIILNVHVSDVSGKPYRELNQADFIIYDNDRAQKLVSFRAVEGSAAQAHVILVLDTVNSSSRQLRYFMKDIEKYLRESDGPLPVPLSIGVLSNARIDMSQPSRDRAALLVELNSRSANLRATGCTANGDRGDTVDPTRLWTSGAVRTESSKELICLNERFISSLTALQQLAKAQVDVPGRAILVWIGPGWPMLTNKAFTPDPPDLKRNFFDQLVSLSMALREAQVTLDAIASPDESINPETPNLRDFDFFAGVASEDQVRAGNLGLHALAHQTGGNILVDARDVAGQLKQCVTDAEAYYVLAFDSPAAAAFGEYHALGVKVDKPGLDVRTNTIYYGEQ